MSALDSIIATPRLVEIDRIDLSAPPGQVWQRVRHAALAQAPVARALFALRTLVDRSGTTARPPAGLRLDDLTSSPQRPGFQVLVDDPPREVVAGAIGQVWRLRIPFVHVEDAGAYAAFVEPGYVKVAWAIRLSPLGEGSTRLELEVRVSATDDAAWRRFRRYFHVIGPASRYIRRSLLRALGRELGLAEPGEDVRGRARAQRAYCAWARTSARTVSPSTGLAAPRAAASNDEHRARAEPIRRGSIAPGAGRQ